MVSMTTYRLDGAKMIGYSDSGLCVWFGGYAFSVYRPAGWQELQHFTSGALCEEVESEKRRRELAKERMEIEGFTIIE
jgi:hypothetical protein